MAAKKYLVTAGVISGPNDAHYQGQEITADDLGVDQARIEHLIEQGALEPVAADKAAKREGAGEVDPDAANEARARAAGIPPSSETTGIAGGAADGTHAGRNPATGDPLAEAVGDPKIAAALRAAGFGTPQEVAGATDEQLRAVGGIGDARLARLRAYAQPGPPVTE